MKKWKGKPLYDLLVDEKANDSGTNKIDFVTRPANQMPMLKFADEEGSKLRLNFSKERRLVTAVIMQPGFPMLRRDESGEEFYVQFSKETIEFMRDKFMMLLKLHERGEQHEKVLSNMDAPLVETWITDESRGISAPKELETVDGSWMGTFRILNNDLWASIQDGTFTGVSLEGIFDLYEAFSEVENFDKGLLNIFKSVIFNKKVSVLDKFNALKSL